MPDATSATVQTAIRACNVGGTFGSFSGRRTLYLIVAFRKHRGFTANHYGCERTAMVTGAR